MVFEQMKIYQVDFTFIDVLPNTLIAIYFNQNRFLKQHRYNQLFLLDRKSKQYVPHNLLLMF